MDNANRMDSVEIGNHNVWICLNVSNGGSFGEGKGELKGEEGRK